VTERQRERPFIRWQAIMREHFGRTSNLLIGLATGLLAYDATLLLDEKLTAPPSSRGS